MELSQYFKSVVEQDKCAVVICDAEGLIIYLNPAARERYKKHGELLGTNIYDCHNEHSREMMKKVVEWFKASPENNIIFAYHNDKENKDAYMIALRNDAGELIGFYEKHEFRDAETAKPYTF